LQFFAAIMPSPLVLVTVGDAKQKGPFLFVSLHPRLPSQVGPA